MNDRMFEYHNFLESIFLVLSVNKQLDNTGQVIFLLSLSTSICQNTCQKIVLNIKRDFLLNINFFALRPHLSQNGL